MKKQMHFFMWHERHWLVEMVKWEDGRREIPYDIKR
jgi:hypothetical protein